MSELKPDVTLDNSGLACPMPIIKTKKAIDAMRVGQVLKMIATDPGSIPDVQAWVSKTGHELLKHETEGNRFIFYIRKAK